MTHLLRTVLWKLPIAWRIRLRRHIELHYHQCGFGDTLLLGAVAREIKHFYGNRVRVVVNGAREELLRGNPRVDSTGNRYRGIDMNYHRGKHHAGAHLERNLLDVMCRRVGIRAPEHRVDLFLDEDEIAYARRTVSTYRTHRRPVITIQSGCGPFGGGRKRWPPEYWTRLVHMLTRHGASVLHVGAAGETAIPGTVSLLGVQDIRRAIAVIGEADVHVGIVSSLMHGSAAVGTPAVIIYGGFERYSAHGYATVHPIESTIDCAPCVRAGTRMPACSLGNECMRRIRPERVFRRILAVLSEQPRPYTVASSHGARTCGV
jgi:ADP-heptose:LPS heptosyltransferase